MPLLSGKKTTVKYTIKTKMKNRRLILHLRSDGTWNIIAKRLIDRKKRYVYVSNFVLSDEGLNTLEAMHKAIILRSFKDSIKEVK